MACIGQFLALAETVSSQMAAMVPVSHQVAKASTAASPVLWYLTRTMGVSAYIALAISVMLGMLRTIARKSSERISWIVDELHQFVATLAGLLVVGHLLALKFDTFMPFSLINLLLPVNEPYMPTAVAFGVFGFYAMVLLLLSSWLRRRLRYSWWRGIHYVSFIAFGLVTLHGWFAGSDSGEPWMRAIYAFSTSAVVFLIVVRFFVGAPSASVSSSAS